MKEFLNKEIIFSINVIFEKWRIVLFIKFEIQNVVDISSLIAIFSNNIMVSSHMFRNLVNVPI